MRADVAALSACGRAAMASRNGHQRRWAVARCVTALQAPGVAAASPAINELSARAMVRVAQAVATLAEAGHAG